MSKLTMAALSMSATLGSVKPLAQQARKPARATRVVTRAAAVSGEVPDMGKRQLMNALLLGAVGAPVAALAGGFAYFFVPPSCVPGRCPPSDDTRPFPRPRVGTQRLRHLTCASQGWRRERWPNRP